MYKKFKEWLVLKEVGTDTAQVATFPRVAIGGSVRMYPEPITMDFEDKKTKLKHGKKR